MIFKSEIKMMENVHPSSLISSLEDSGYEVTREEGSIIVKFHQLSQIMSSMGTSFFFKYATVSINAETISVSLKLRVPLLMISIVILAILSFRVFSNTNGEIGFFQLTACLYGLFAFMFVLFSFLLKSTLARDIKKALKKN